MILIVFGIVVIIGQALNIALCLALDQIFSPMVGALAFVFLYIVEGRQKSWRTATANR
jgi:hypothetical protein